MHEPKVRGKHLSGCMCVALLPIQTKEGREAMRKGMSLEEAKKLIFAYACCGTGKCEICPLIGTYPSAGSNGEKLANIDDAVEIVAREQEQK